MKMLYSECFIERKTGTQMTLVFKIEIVYLRIFYRMLIHILRGLIYPYELQSDLINFINQEHLIPTQFPCLTLAEGFG